MSGLRDASTVEVVPDSLTLDVTYQSDKPHVPRPVPRHWSTAISTYERIRRVS
jgi:hypothetical protein